MGDHPEHRSAGSQNTTQLNQADLLDDSGFRAVCWRDEFEPMAYIPESLWDDVQTAGLVLPTTHALQLACFSEALSLGSALEAVFQDLTLRWHKQSRLPAWRNEAFAVHSAGAIHPRFRLERIAARHLGFRTGAVHVNGLSADGRTMWLARRSMAKDSDPGLLDNMVAGGVSAGEPIEQCLWRECWEEAGIQASGEEAALFHSGLRPLRCLHIQGVEGLDGPWPHIRRERIYAFSLELPSGFVPSNQDGEVSEYLCVDRARLRHLIAEGALTRDAAIVAGLWLA